MTVPPTPRPQFSTVVLDLHGTLVHQYRDEALEIEVRYGIGRSVLQSAFNEARRKMLKELKPCFDFLPFAPGVAFWRAYYQLTAEVLGRSDIGEGLFSLFSRASSDASNFIVTGEVVATLAKIHVRRNIVVLSNATQSMTDVMEPLGLARHVDVVIPCLEYSCLKPGRRSYELALRSVSAAPSESLMIGDRGRADFTGPWRAGIAAVQVNRASNQRRRLAIPDADGRGRLADERVLLDSDLTALLDAIEDLGRRVGRGDLVDPR